MKEMRYFNQLVENEMVEVMELLQCELEMQTFMNRSWFVINDLIKQYTPEKVEDEEKD